ncbi:MAG: hypothetical protein J6D30_04820 [Clostridia bacterium]|nr:hypothetical protein [Clostridia bacterium]
MNKKVVAVLLGALSVLCFAGCKEKEEEPSRDVRLCRFVLLSDDDPFLIRGIFLSPVERLFVDRETRVIYCVSEDFMIYLVDAEGKPLLYEGDLE